MKFKAEHLNILNQKKLHKRLGEVRIIAFSTDADSHEVNTVSVEMEHPPKDPYGEPYKKTWEVSYDELMDNSHIGAPRMPHILSFTRKPVSSIEKVSDFEIEIQYDDGEIQKAPIIPINTRQEALEFLENLTKKALQWDGIFDYLENLKPKSSYRTLRNYEIEDSIEFLTKEYYKIKEPCPFNKFSWFM